VEHDRPLRLIIEVEQTEPLAGSIGDEHDGMRPFLGWFGLGSELDRLLTAADEAEVGNPDTS
jgi:hypothetical protein